MQPNSNRKPGESPQVSPSNAGQNDELSLADLLPGVFDEPAPPPPTFPTTPPVPAPPIFYAPPPSTYVPSSPMPPQVPSNSRAQSWVQENFEDTSNNVTTVTTPSGETTVAPVGTRIRKRLPVISFIKPGRWMIFVAMVLFALLIGAAVSLLYLNNFIGAVAPSNSVLDAYPGASRVTLNDEVSGFLLQADQSFASIPKSVAVPEVSNDDTSKIVSYYNNSLAVKGFKGSSVTATNPYGPETAVTYSNGKQTVRVDIVTMSADAPALGLKKGQNLIILIAGTLVS